MKKTENNPSRDPKPVLTGEEADPISLKQAAEWTANYRARFPNEVISYFFGMNIINEILRQEGCVGLRVYYANSKALNSFQKIILAISNFLRKTIANAEGEKHLIVVGSDKYGNDQLPTNGDRELRRRDSDKIEETVERKSALYSGESELEKYTIAEQALPCPGPGCPANKLTSSK